MMLKLSLLIVFVALLACERNDVMTYKVPKQTLLVAQLSQNDSLKTINWIIPDAWIKQPDTEFRLASYQVPALDSSNELGDFSIVKFPGDAGGVLANVNRWRKQLSLDPITVDDLVSLLVPVQHSELSISFIQLDNVTKQSSGSSFEAMYVGFFIANDHSYFFKLTGSKNLLRAYYDNFITILRTITYETPK